MPSAVLLLPRDAPAALERARQVVDAGGVVLFPTESVYGLGGRCDRPEAIERLYVLKGRPREKPFQWLVPDAAMARARSDDWSEAAARLARAFWPGPLTLVVRAAGQTVGWRVPRHDWLHAFLQELSVPLVATSANRAGQPAPADFPAALRPFDGQIDLAVDGGPARGGIASTVVAAVDGTVKVLREGAIPAVAIAEVAAA